MTLRVVLGEDNYLASEGIARVIERAEGLELVATRPDLQSLLDVIAEEQPKADQFSTPRRRHAPPRRC